MNLKKEVIIVGGGLAGLTAAIHLSKMGFQVVLIEKNQYPKHKVCGEYISNEVIPYLKQLEIDISELHPVSISKIKFSTVNGKVINGQLHLGGFGISRYALDEFLFNKAVTNGCTIIEQTVEDIVFNNDEFTVRTSQQSVFKSKVVIGAFGKRSNIDQSLNRHFVQQKSPWLAVKAHYKGAFPSDVVGLHNFKGGYCGVSKVENDAINVCYLADYKTFKKHKNIEEYQKQVVSQNPHLKSIFEDCTMLFDKPLTISQISFEKKEPVENHIIMIGDTAGLIHPLCGNGMAMAIHSAKLACEVIEQFFNSKLSRVELELKYKQQWNYYFKSRISTGRVIAALLKKQRLSETLLSLLGFFPSMLQEIIKKTHGKPIILNH